ncbi:MULTISPECIES: alpha/beta fold hydrolase [unclassified Xanthobacter]|uniref:alpha/beta fold hydrolase n=1 Tax=unclassified Xanthobacter TaxID=2623496 RepID=UPI001F2231DC|nr:MULTISPECIES: alpha/beta hydrolase [unclassified Xanthobacter]
MIMSNTGNPATLPGNAEAIAALTAPPPEGREAYIEHQLGIWRRIWSPGFPMEDDRARRFLTACYDRALNPAGMARQNLALLATGDRRRKFATVRVTTLVVHGAADPLLPVAAGREAAEVIPGAALLVIDGMAHDLPVETWPRLVSAIADNARGSVGWGISTLEPRTPDPPGPDAGFFVKTPRALTGPPREGIPKLRASQMAGPHPAKITLRKRRNAKMK